MGFTLGFLVGYFLMLFAALAIYGVNPFRPYHKPRIIFGEANRAATPEPPRIDRNVRLLTREEHIGIARQILPGNMLAHLKAGNRHHVVTPDGKLEAK